MDGPQKSRLNLHQTDKLCGYPALEIRGLFRALSASLDKWNGQTARQRLGITAKAAQKLAGQLCAAGFLAITGEHGGVVQYQVTIAGRALAMARAVKPIKRATAERVLAEFLERVRAVNEDPGLLHWVDEVLVFGSYLSESPSLGDIDLGMTMNPRVPLDSDEFKERAKSRVKLAEDQGRHFPTFLDRLFWPHQEVKMRLRGRVTSLSIHDLDGERSFIEAIPHRQVYLRTP